MEAHEKVIIYVPKRVRQDLEADARSFEIKKPNGDINMNKLLCGVVLGHHRAYHDHVAKVRDDVLEALSQTPLSAALRASAANEVTKRLSMSKQPRRWGSNSERLSLKPTRAIEAALREIRASLDRGDGRAPGSLSGYLCGLLSDYLTLPKVERERILFQSSCQLLLVACERRRDVSFVTTWHRGVRHQVTPFELLAGSNEQHNYLLCAEDVEGKQVARSYRLDRIEAPVTLPSRGEISATVREHLERTARHGAAHAINGDEEIRVRLTSAGEVQYDRIYFGRPEAHDVESSEGNKVYVFDCSEDQAFLYFRRFGKDAEVLSTDRLRRRIADFHKSAMDLYETDGVAHPRRSTLGDGAEED